MKAVVCVFKCFSVKLSFQNALRLLALVIDNEFVAENLPGIAWLRRNQCSWARRHHIMTSEINQKTLSFLIESVFFFRSLVTVVDRFSYC